MDIEKFMISFAVFLVLVYNIFVVDYLSSRVTLNSLQHPLVRFVILVLMVVAYQFDHYLAIIIGFGFLYTLISLNSKKYINKTVAFDTTPTFIEKENVEMSQKFVAEKSDFTTNEQFNDAQSNIVNNKALETEIRTWPEGYGTQGGFMSES
tara:strand:+ start:362 stop:814 length:453 start_codon:yes stop_codon:yes gene_type:complete